MGGARRAGKAGLTVIELVVVISVIAILVGLLLPAVQAGRESTRRAQCQNNVRQIALATNQFHNIHRKFPSNGWGYAWMGTASRGVGPKQPGGWIFQSLPFLEQDALYRSTNMADGPSQNVALGKLASTSLEVFLCPSRPGNILQSQSNRFVYRNATTPAWVARTDYAINEGDWISDTDSGPTSYAQADQGNYAWTDATKVTGVSWQHGSIAISQIADGSSHTYLAGEKRAGISGLPDWGNDQSMFSGVDIDITRWTIQPPARDGKLDNPLERRFGSAHGTGCNMAMCDGSVRFVSFSIHPDIHRVIGNRKDGAIGDE